MTLQADGYRRLSSTIREPWPLRDLFLAARFTAMQIRLPRVIPPKQHSLAQNNT